MGKGCIVYSNEDYYIGEVNLNGPHGEGKYTAKDGSYYQGKWQNHEKHG